jgi:hypothetical protein
MLRKLAMWAVWNLPLGRYAPQVFGFAVGSKKYIKLEKTNE